MIWSRVFLFICVATVVFAVIAAFDAIYPSWALSAFLCVFGSLVAAAYWQWLQVWLNPEAGAAEPAAPAPGSEPSTVFYVVCVHLGALFFMNFASTLVLDDLDILVRSKNAGFTDYGSVVIQFYLVATMFPLVWLPAATALGVRLGQSRRKIAYWLFLAGALLSLPGYAVIAGISTLGTGFGDMSGAAAVINQHDAASGAHINPLIASVETGLIALVIFSIYPWLVARGTRWISERWPR
ncbi:MAG TPA: hypothetical protein VGB91_01095 [Rhizomicrobium sp.]